jgi:hypothetical protein
MAYAPSAVARPAVARRRVESPAAPPATRGLFARLVDAIAAANQRRAEREITRFLANHGGKLTDEVEREIERRFLASGPRSGL